MHDPPRDKVDIQRLVEAAAQAVPGALVRELKHALSYALNVGAVA